jgi:VanZ family protein
MIRRPFRSAVLWLVVVLVLGSAYFGPKQTQHHVMPALQTLAPWMLPSGAQTVHALLRKVSHLSEYAVLALLWVRAFRSGSRFGLGTASAAALAVCLSCAVVDEVHQTLTPGRHGSAADVALDSLGAVVMLIVVRARPRIAERADGQEDPPRTLGTVQLDERT